MKKLNESMKFMVIAILVAANVYIFLLSTTTSTKMESYEQDIKALHLANMELEKKAYERGSLEFVASEAAILNFTPSAQTMVIQGSGVALAPR